MYNDNNEGELVQNSSLHNFHNFDVSTAYTIHVDVVTMGLSIKYVRSEGGGGGAPRARVQFGAYVLYIYTNNKQISVYGEGLSDI